MTAPLYSTWTLDTMQSAQLGLDERHYLPPPDNVVSLSSRALNEGLWRFHNQEEGPFLGLLQVESAYYHFHTLDTPCP